ncbi:hypothetical protein HYT02_05655 [Candidatus Gottesmanbacteria bacterium]|nr:hypothetical protein [Candidatus Gottesmanbacteria bacterium]
MPVNEVLPTTQSPPTDRILLGKNSKQWTHIALGLNVIILSILLIFGGIYIFKKGFSKTKAGSDTISGTVNINGYVPSGASITIASREHGTTNFANVVTGISSTDGVAYSWNEAEGGKMYDIQASLVVNNQNISQSDIYTISAPASGEILTINSTAVPPSQGLSTISGKIDLNGFVPNGATVAVSAQDPQDSSFRPVVGGFAAVDGATWIWNSAQTGTSYQLQATLMSGTTAVGQSNTITVTSPADSEVLTINSTATPPAPQVTSISGSINFNGSVLGGSTISVAYRITGQTNFTMFAQNLPANSGTSWNFTQASSGTSYDFQAYMITQGTPSAASQILTATAPAANEVLTLNVTNQPSGPAASNMTTNCTSANSSGVWQVQFNYNNGPAVTNAQQYWLTVGTNSGGNQLVNNTYAPSNANQPQSYTSGFIFSQNTTYYAQWAYATCTNCSSFSNFAPSIQFSCGTPGPSAISTPVPTPTDTPPPTPTTLPPTNTP